MPSRVMGPVASGIPFAKGSSLPSPTRTWPSAQAASTLWKPTTPAAVVSTSSESLVAKTLPSRPGRSAVTWPRAIGSLLRPSHSPSASNRDRAGRVREEREAVGDGNRRLQVGAAARGQRAVVLADADAAESDLERAPVALDEVTAGRRAGVRIEIGGALGEETAHEDAVLFVADARVEAADRRPRQRRPRSPRSRALDGPVIAVVPARSANLVRALLLDRDVDVDLAGHDAGVVDRGVDARVGDRQLERGGPASLASRFFSGVFGR